MDYQLVRGDEKSGPYPAARLAEMAAAGEISGDDSLIDVAQNRRLTAREVPEVYAALQARAAAATVAEPQPGGVPSSPPLNRDWRQKSREFVDAGSRRTGLDAATFVLVAGGVVLFVLIMLCSFFTWDSLVYSQKVVGTLIVEGTWNSGVSLAEGKLVFIGVLLAVVLLLLSTIKKSFLRPAILAAAGVAVFATVILLALRSRSEAVLDAELAAMESYKSAMTSNPLTQIGVDAMEQTGSTFATISGGASWTLAFVILCAVASSVMFGLASLRYPQSLGFLQKAEYPPLVQRHGATGIVLLTALLAGVIFAVIRE